MHVAVDSFASFPDSGSAAVAATKRCDVNSFERVFAAMEREKVRSFQLQSGVFQIITCLYPQCE
jgi:hypothetical protein